MCETCIECSHISRARTKQVFFTLIIDHQTVLGWILELFTNTNWKQQFYLIFRCKISKMLGKEKYLMLLDDITFQRGLLHIYELYKCIVICSPQVLTVYYLFGIGLWWYKLQKALYFLIITKCSDIYVWGKKENSNWKQFLCTYHHSLFVHKCRLVR